MSWWQGVLGFCAGLLISVVVGIVGGMYGIGGASLLRPILVGRGLPVTKVAPAALACTFITSIAGALTHTVLALITPGDITPCGHWGCCVSWAA